MRVEGIEQIEQALLAMTGRQRQNVERKAARASMGKMKRFLQTAWRTMTVMSPSPAGRSIRKHAAKALTVKVSTRGGFVSARVFMRYSKKNAQRARLSHLLEWGHATGGGPRVPARILAATGGVDPAKRARKMLGASGRGWSEGMFPSTATFRSKHGIVRDAYMKALMLWLMNPKLKQAQVRGRI